MIEQEHTYWDKFFRVLDWLLPITAQYSLRDCFATSLYSYVKVTDQSLFFQYKCYNSATRFNELFDFLKVSTHTL